METRKEYTAPILEIIILDKEISLALQSAPPEGPGEVNNITPDQLKKNPFNDRMA